LREDIYAIAHVQKKAGAEMDDIDRSIINEIQSDFPITERPFQELANRFRLSEDEVLGRVKKLKEEGVIRRIGGNFNSKKLNFTSTHKNWPNSWKPLIVIQALLTII
jgi:DNA-binding Lrp family transcriptional regulator